MTTSNTSFKQYLLAEEVVTDNWFFTSKSQINAWMKAQGISKVEYEINSDNSVSHYGHSILISNSDLIWYKGKQCVLPINFRSCGGDFSIGTGNLISLKGVPRKVGDAFKVKSFAITSVEYLPETAEDIYLHSSGIIELKGIEKWVRRAYSISVPNDVKGLLSLVKIDKLNMVTTTGTASDKLKHACEIVTKYCQANQHDVIACQRELIENDLDEYAEF